MSRHRNIRQLCADDILTYDEPLASSVDDDYGFSPNTTDLYIHDASRGDFQSLVFSNENEPLNFSAEDFPSVDSNQEELIPDVSGRIRSQAKPRVNGFTSRMDDADAVDLEMRELMVGDYTGSTSAAANRITSHSSAQLEQLPQDFSQKISLSTPAKDTRNPVRSASNTPSVVSTPSKPIDRKPLVEGYKELLEQSGEKEIVNLIVLGHVDAGKSTLMGNLLCQLGRVSDKQLSKYRWESQKLGKSSFAYAWVLDQTSEERNRGVTMDIAQTSFETKTKRVALMDAPGHKDFVPRVIGGASQADAALLVVNATNGEFETGFGSGGQTREHTRLARLLGVSHLIVAVNKMDTVDWDKERFETIKTQMTSFLKQLNLTGIVFCPVSGLTGVNVAAGGTSADKASTEEGRIKLSQWYDGPKLLDLIDVIPTPERLVDGAFRFVVSDIFKPAGLSIPAVAGRVLSGAVSGGVNLPTSRVICHPSGLPGTVKSIRSFCAAKSTLGGAEGGDLSDSFLDQVVKCAFAGDQVALILNGIDPSQSLAPGDVISDPDNPVPSASRIKAKILVFAVNQPITRGYPVIFHYHCTSVSANVTKLISMSHKQNRMEKVVRKPRCLFGNCTAEVEITFDRPVCLEVHEKCKALGRFMLRVGGDSIAGGTVTAVLPPKRNRLVDR